MWTLRAPLCLAVEAVDRLAHEQHLAGEVGVVGAGLRAGLDQRQAVAAVGADGRRDHARAAGQLRHRGGVGHVGGQQRPVGRARAERGADRLKALPRAAGQADPDAVGRMRGKVLGGQPADEAGRAEDGDVEIPLYGHRKTLP